MRLPFVAQSSVTDNILRYYLDHLTTPEGLTLGLMLLCIPVALLMADRLKWALLAVLIYVSTYSIKRYYIDPLPGVFGQIAEVGQLLAVALFLFMAVPAVRPQEWRRSKVLHPATIALFVLQVAICLRQMSAGYSTRALAGLAVNGLMLLLLGIGLGRSVVDARHVGRLVRAVSWAGALTILGSLYLLLFQPGAALHGGRLYGTTGNPQRLAATLALVVPFSCALLMDRTNSTVSRTFHGAVTALGILMAFGTGSRMGMLLVVVGLVLYFRNRIGPALVGGTLLGAFVLLGYQMVGESLSGGIERASDTTDTRTHVWSELVQWFLQSPLWGRPAEGALGESSYLSIAAGYGLIGLVPLTIFMYLLIRGGLHVLRRRSSLGPQAPLGDLLVASLAQFATAWLFEAFLLGNFTDNMIILYCSLILLAYLTEQISLAQTSSPQFPAAQGDPLDFAADEHEPALA